MVCYGLGIPKWKCRWSLLRSSAIKVTSCTADLANLLNGTRENGLSRAVGSIVGSIILHGLRRTHSATERHGEALMTQNTSENNLVPVDIAPIEAAESAMQDLAQNTKQTIRRLLKEAILQHTVLCDHLGDSVYAAVVAARSLRAIEPLVNHGTYEKFVTESYCKPLGVSFRTIQRYVKLSKAFDEFVQRIREEDPSFAEADERSIVRGKTFSEARLLIRNLLSSDSIDKNDDDTTKLLELADRNGWDMPDTIVRRILDLIPVVDVDPFSIPGRNVYSALTVVHKPSNGLSMDCEWYGKLVLNPGIVGTKFTDLASRLVSDFENQRIQEALAFVPATMNSKHAYLLRKFPRVFVNKHLHVTGPSIDQTIKVPMMMVYVANPKRFSEFFRAFHCPELFDPFAPVVANS